MKTIKKGKITKRVSNKDAKQQVQSGWEYCPKHEWKKNVRDVDESSRGLKKGAKKKGSK